MKTITIGRGEGCHIYIDDESMSRRHAIIKIPTFGGMEIVDMSKNGTFVNGVRLRPNVPFPVKRTDVVNFADVAQLDWSQVPDPMKYYKLGAAIVGGLVVLLLAFFLLKALFISTDVTPTKDAVEQVQPADSNVKQQLPEAEQAPREQADTEEAIQNPENSESTSEGQNARSDYQDPVREFNKVVQANKEKREAEERARQQKAKEQKAKEQQQKEQQQKEQQKEQQKQPDSQKQEDSKPSDGGSSGKKEYKPEMI